MYKTTSTASAAILAAMLGFSPAIAADLGGSCCADLEERVSELEATVVRKGNRKVSIKLSGWVNEAVMYWDDGVESDIYQVNNSHFVSRFRLDGSAKITNHLSAGYKQEFYLIGATSGGVNQDNDDRPSGEGDSGFVVGQHFWYINHKHLGQVSVGRRGSATDELALLDLGGARAHSGMDTANVGGGLWLTQGSVNGAGGATRMATIFTPIDIARGEVVRYDSPIIAGFKVSAAWGEDDIWDVALRFATEMGGIRVVAGIGYFDTTDNRGQSNVGGAPTVDDEGDNRFLGSISVWDAGNTGLYTTAFFNKGEDGGRSMGGAKENRDTMRWGVRLGWRNKLMALGKTNVYADYQKAEADNLQVNLCTTTTSPTNCTRTAFTGDQEGEQWGFGVVQDIDAAAMQLYMRYKHLDFDVRDRLTGAKANVNDMQILHAGGIIKF